VPNLAGVEGTAIVRQRRQQKTISTGQVGWVSKTDQRYAAEEPQIPAERYQGK